MSPASRSLGPGGLAPLVAVILLGSCQPGERVHEALFERPPGETPHHEYRLALGDAGLLATALGTAWVGAAERALFEPQTVSLPYREEGWMPAGEPGAVGLSFEARRGQTIRAELELEGDDPPGVFLDLFRVAGSGEELRHLAAEGPDRSVLEHEAGITGEYVLRIQPELLRDLGYRLSLRVGPAFAFPVEGRQSGDIGSRFGAARDGGRREHHGVDIFAPRGTPVLSASHGIVRRVTETSVGGRQVWIRDEVGNRSLYYAHLDRQLVDPGMQVAPGDTLGLVGNTGNARTTPPHLHFGLYVRGEGPVDPFDFLHDPGGRFPPPATYPERTGKWARTDQGAPLRAAPSSSAERVKDLGRHTPVQVKAAVGDWLRVRLPDGQGGFVSAGLVGGIGEALERRPTPEPATVRSAPGEGADVVIRVPGGAVLEVLGRFEEDLFVRAPGGPVGWVVGPLESVADR